MVRLVDYAKAAVPNKNKPASSMAARTEKDLFIKKLGNFMFYSCFQKLENLSQLPIVGYGMKLGIQT